MRNTRAVDPDETYVVPSKSWWANLSEEPEPYETAAWEYVATALVEEGESCDIAPKVGKSAVDPDSLDCEEQEAWWESLGDEGPKPYSTAAWAYLVTEVSEENSTCEPSPTASPHGADFDSVDCHQTGAWYESLGGEGPKPYATATWTYLEDSSIILEFVLLDQSAYSTFDEGQFGQAGLRAVFDNGLFGSTPPFLLTGAFYSSYGFGIEVARTFAQIKIYDSKASSPGFTPNLQIPLGTLATEPEGIVTDSLLLDPETLGDAFLGSDPNGTDVVTDTPTLGPIDIVGDGNFDGVFIEASRVGAPGDDRPPGQLLGQISYEMSDTVVTITSWEHYNWEDSTPVRKAVEVLLDQLPGAVEEVKVLDDPTAFWTALGFKRAFKGDPYIHYFPG